MSLDINECLNKNKNNYFYKIREINKNSLLDLKIQKKLNKVIKDRKSVV